MAGGQIMCGRKETDMFEENVLISFLRKFDQYPFLVKFQDREYLIGEGAPVFTVKFNRMIPLQDLMTSTSLALGEACMDGILEIEGDPWRLREICFLPWIISWARWENFPQTRMC